jgi:hypothetical protein
MSEAHCPHCGAQLPLVRGAFCIACLRSLEQPFVGEPPVAPPTGQVVPSPGSEQPRKRQRLQWFGAAGAAIGLLWGLGTAGKSGDWSDGAEVAGYLVGSVTAWALLAITAAFLAGLAD